MSNAIIQSLFDTEAQAFADSQSLPIRFPGQDFVPPNNADQEDNLYLAAFFLPALTVSQTLAGDDQLFRGVYQIGVVAPRGFGSARAREVVALLAAIFPCNRLYTHTSGFQVQQVSPLSEPAPIEGPTEYTLATSFNYRAHV